MMVELLSPEVWVTLFCRHYNFPENLIRVFLKVHVPLEACGAPGWPVSRQAGLPHPAGRLVG